MDVSKPGTGESARRAGFSVMELVVAIAILAILAGTLVPVVASKLAAARDARRLTDVKTVVDAIESYLVEKGKLPDGDRENGTGGYDTTLDQSFLTALLASGHLREPLRDPTNDPAHHYRFQHYPSGVSGFASDFYVVGITGFETSGYAKQRGYWKGSDRDWTDDFAYVTGGAAH